MSTPVLDTIRALLKFKSFTTIAEIASMVGLKRIDVLNVVNANLDLIKRDAKRGRIIGLDLQGPLRKQLWESGKFWKQDTYGAWSHEGDCITLADCQKELAERLTKQQIVGAFGDSYYVGVIHLTQANIAAVEAEGIRPWTEAIIDDRLWKEHVA
ncbi:hypothetical protein [Rhizobium rhizogenes]|uniref:hypothetical protein n=1 Tax=Rhizobium rhizogenes TaxID=359 RepID=UPI001572502E|nr:hypothetical protein [Rhizobium rhizogenes]NTG07128.1 hypothetical protein [Rhizobium rhizogenes]